VGNELRSLEISTNPYPIDDDGRLSRYSKRWESFISDASSGRRYSSVTTFITNWTPRPAKFIQAVTNLIPHIRACTLKIDPDTDSLVHLGTNNELKLEKVPLTGIDIVTVKIGDPESSYLPSLNALEEGVLPQFEETLPDLLSSRLRSGAEPIRKVILQSFSKFDCPEVREFPQANGVLIQLEACNS